MIIQKIHFFLLLHRKPSLIMVFT